jgi:hypothetical protein
VGALATAFFIALSPTLLYFSRFDREDIYTPSGPWPSSSASGVSVGATNLWLYLGAASMAFSFATKESTFLTAAIFLSFLEALVALDLLGQARRQREMDRVEAGSILVWLLVFSWLVVILWPLLSSLRQRFGMQKLPAAAVPLLVLGTLAAPLYAGAIQLIGDYLPLLPGNSGYQSDSELGLRNGSVTVLLILSLYVGLLWNPRVWLISAACFYVVYVLLFTTFFTNMPGFWTGIWGSTDYWIEQQSVRRGEQPLFYYFMILPVYEFLPLLLAIGGAIWLSFRGHAFTLFLVFWIAASLLAFTVAGEKMPWLTVHMAPAHHLLAGRTVWEKLYGQVSCPAINEIAEALRMVVPSLDSRIVLALGPAVAALAVIILIVMSASVTSVVLVMVVLVPVMATAVWIAGQAGRRVLVQAGTATVIAGLLVFSIRTAGVASFEHGDIPVELLVYADLAGCAAQGRHRER